MKKLFDSGTRREMEVAFAGGQAIAAAAFAAGEAAFLGDEASGTPHQTLDALWDRATSLYGESWSPYPRANWRKGYLAARASLA